MKIATKKAVEKTQPLKYMNYLFAFLGRDFQLNHTGTATKIVETQPETTPTAIGIANERSVESPKNSETITTVKIATNVETEVIIERPKHWLILVLTFSFNVAVGISLLFSRIRS